MLISDLNTFVLIYYRNLEEKSTSKISVNNFGGVFIGWKKGKYLKLKQLITACQT